MRVPTTAPADVQQALREVWAALDRLGAAGALNVDLKGKRTINAGDAIDQTDYVTLRQLRAGAGAGSTPDPLTIKVLTVEQVATLRGAILIPQFTDGSAHNAILFVDNTGRVAIEEDGHYTFDLNRAVGQLELGYDLKIHWITGRATIASPADGVIALGNNAATGFLALVLGPVDSAAHPALVKNGATFEMRAGTVGALTNLLLAVLNATTVNATTVNAATVNVGTLTGGSSPTFGDVTATHFIATGAQTYHPTIPGTRRTFDSSTVTLSELAEVVGTLLGDLAGIRLVN